MSREKELPVAAWFAATCFAILLSLLTAAGGNAEGPCADDVAKFCKEAQKTRGGIAKCLKEHADELSPACREKIGEAKKKIRDFAEACKADLSAFCKDVKPGGGRLLQCLKQHESELSPECKAQMPSGK